MKAYWLYLRALYAVYAFGEFDYRPVGLFWRAANLGHAESQYRYALFEAQYDVNDDSESVFHMTMAALQGHKKATLWLDNRRLNK